MSGIDKVEIDKKAREKSAMRASCQVCGSEKWRRLPDPVPGQSITTAGRIVSQPLGKAQCGRCGFVQRISGQYLGETDYYEKDYARYYDRPGTNKYHAERYRVLADWMKSALHHNSPKRILDAGCGQGWAMEAMRLLYPEAVIEGIDPSHFNCEVARTKGFTVCEGRLGEIALPGPKYDLVFSNNVIQHVLDAGRFVSDLRNIVKPGGTVIITCPDASIPNIEILWSDQNFSFLPQHLVQLCRGNGFESIEWFASPSSPSLPPAQMVMISFKVIGGDEGKPKIPELADLDRIFELKSTYLNSFGRIESHLLSCIADAAAVYNFGASYWSSILAAYCPLYWDRVDACVVDTLDGLSGEFLGKRVCPIEALTIEAADVIVLGTGPSTHESLRARIRSYSAKIARWDQFMKY